MKLTKEQEQFLTEIYQESFQSDFDKWIENMELEYTLAQVR